MNNSYIKKALSAALAALVLAMTSCGNITEKKDTPPTKKPDTDSSSATPSDEPVVTSDEYSDTPAPLSVAPLSSVTLDENDILPDADFYASYRDYAAELFKAVCTDDIKSGKNAMISPESVMMALGMTANGAKGDTLSQMETALGGKGIDAINNAMQYRMNRFMANEDVSFNVANSVWVRDDANRIQMSQDFCDKVKSVYNADSFLAPFDSTTLDDINSWVNKNTNNMIPNILDDIPDEAVAYLINAIAFEGAWADNYEVYQISEDDKFTNYKGEEEKAVMLYSQEGSYFSDENTTGFMKDYEGHDYAFMAMLPSEDTDIADYVAGIDGDKLSKLWRSASGDVNVCIPEFTFDYNNELSDELKSMGMELPFTESADFSGMAETSSGALYINRVIHKTHIELDRNGTKAAAATAVEMTDECAMEEEEPKIVYLNRPFVYAIIDKESGTPIFIGAVNTLNG